MVKKLNKKTNKLMIEELFSNSFFDGDLYNILEKIVQLKATKRTGYYPKEKNVVKQLTTLRNRNLISQEQQKVLQNTIVGFFGLSVGSHAALTWMMESRADFIKISDPDIISATNLNRLRLGLHTIGKAKTDIFKQQLLDINPYTKVITSRKTDTKSVIQLFDQKPKLDIVIDAIDDIPGKVLLRKLSKIRKIPLLQFTDVGDNIIIDVERYDLHPQPEFFLGQVPHIQDYNFSALSETDRIKIILQIVGLENCSEEMLDSLLSIGKTISTWPQLGATATIAGGIATTVIKKIILHEMILSNRYVLSLDSLFHSENIQKVQRKYEFQRKIHEQFQSN